MAAVTVLANARIWHEASSAAHWTALATWDTGTALYVVVQDTGATPKVRVLKADSRTAPSAFTEQDSANNKAITNVAFPFSSWYDATTGYIHVGVFTATNTITHYRFNTATNLWGTGFGTVTTAAENEHSIRVVVRSDNDVLVFFTSNADDADLGWARYEGVSWTVAATGILSANSTGASSIMDAGIDSTDRAWVVFYNVATPAVRYLTINSSNTVAAAVDLSAFAMAATNQNSGARYNLYVDGTTDKVTATFTTLGTFLNDAVITLESDAAAGNVGTLSDVESTPAKNGLRTPVSTATFSATPYAAWWDDGTGTGVIYYSTRSGTTWAAETTWKTGVSRLVELVPVGTGLLGVYHSDATTVVVDWIVSPGTPATMTVIAASTPASGLAVTLTAASKFTVVAAATPAAASLSLVGQGLLTVTAAESPAGSGNTAFTAASLFSILAAVSPALGGDVDLHGPPGIPADLTVVAASSSASGLGVLLSGLAQFTVTAAPAPAAGLDVSLNGAALFTVIASSAPAAGLIVILSGAGRIIIVESSSPAAGLSVSLTASAFLSALASLASASASSTFESASNLTAGIATAPGISLVTLRAASIFAPFASEAPSSAFSSLVGQARFALIAALASAESSSSLQGMGQFTSGIAASPAQGAAVVFDAASQMVLAQALAAADSTSVALGAGSAAVLTITPSSSPASSFGEFRASSIFAVALALANGTGENVALTAASKLTLSSSLANASSIGVVLGAGSSGLLSVSASSAPASSDSAFAAASVYGISSALSSSLGLDVNLTAASIFAVLSALASANIGDVDLSNIDKFEVGAASASALAFGESTGLAFFAFTEALASARAYNVFPRPYLAVFVNSTERTLTRVSSISSQVNTSVISTDSNGVNVSSTGRN